MGSSALLLSGPGTSRQVELEGTLAARGLGGWPDKPGVPDTSQGVMPIPYTSERGTAARRGYSILHPLLFWGSVSPCMWVLSQRFVSHSIPGYFGGLSVPVHGFPAWPLSLLALAQCGGRRSTAG